jgi:hypothetical protein
MHLISRSNRKASGFPAKAAGTTRATVFSRSITTRSSSLAEAFSFNGADALGAGDDLGYNIRSHR